MEERKTQKGRWICPGLLSSVTEWCMIPIPWLTRLCSCRGVCGWLEHGEAWKTAQLHQEARNSCCCDHLLIQWFSPGATEESGLPALPSAARKVSLPGLYCPHLLNTALNVHKAFQKVLAQSKVDRVPQPLHKGARDSFQLCPRAALGSVRPSPGAALPHPGHQCQGSSCSAPAWLPLGASLGMTQASSSLATLQPYWSCCARKAPLCVMV